MKIQNTYASDSGHWYTRDGQPAYTQISAKGTERPTTLRDARKLGLVPSVTTILNVAAKPALEAWKVRQALLAALTLPQEEGESLDAFIKRADADAKEQAKQAAEEGTRIHTAIERSYLGQGFDATYREHVEAVKFAMKEHFGMQNWSAEKSFCSARGYGGRVDLHSKDVVIDIKGKEFGPDDKVVAYDEQIMQLDAYRHGLGIPHARMANVFVSRSHPGLVKVIEHSTGTHFEMFLCLLQYWKLSKDYDPMAGLLREGE